MVSGHNVILLSGDLIALAQCLRREPLHDDYLPGSDRWQPRFGPSHLGWPTWMDGGRLAGIITDRDIAIRVIAENNPRNTGPTGLQRCRPSHRHPRHRAGTGR